MGAAPLETPAIIIYAPTVSSVVCTEINDRQGADGSAWVLLESPASLPFATLFTPAASLRCLLGT